MSWFARKKTGMSESETRGVRSEVIAKYDWLSSPHPQKWVFTNNCNETKRATREGWRKVSKRQRGNHIFSTQEKKTAFICIKNRGALLFCVPWPGGFLGACISTCIYGQLIKWALSCAKVTPWTPGHVWRVQSRTCSCTWHLANAHMQMCASSTKGPGVQVLYYAFWSWKIIKYPMHGRLTSTGSDLAKPRNIKYRTYNNWKKRNTSCNLIYSRGVLRWIWIWISESFQSFSVPGRKSWG